MRVRMGLVNVGLAASLLALGACSADDEAAESTPAKDGAGSETCENGPGVTDSTIKIGVTTPLSGPAATTGQAHLAGQQAYVDKVNADGGIHGRQLELVTQDDTGDPQKAAANAQYLIEREGVFALWGNVGSAAASAIQPIAEKADVPLLFPFALGRTLTEPAQPNTFSIATPAYLQTRILSDFLANEPDFADKKVGLMVINSPDGAETAEGFADGASSENIVSSQTYEPGSPTFKAQLLSFKEAGADFVYAGINDAQFAKLLTEAEELGMSDVTFYGAVSVVTPAVVELTSAELAEGNLGGVFVALPDGDAEGLADIETALDGEKVGTHAVHAWAGGMIIAEAIDRAGECLNADTLRDALESGDAFDTGGLTDEIVFSTDEHLGNASMLQVEMIDGVWTPFGDGEFQRFSE